jgi:hypothetical protein
VNGKTEVINKNLQAIGEKIKVFKEAQYGEVNKNA